MSEPVSFYLGRVAKGAVTVSDAGLQGMITLRGDLGNAKLKAAVKKVSGVAVPAVRKAVVTDGRGAAWMSPDELLVFVPYAEADAAAAALSTALKGLHHMAVNVSDARAYIRVEGAGAAEVMAKNAPADLSPAAFAAGDFRRTRLGQTAAAFWRDAAGAFHVICFRSVGDYAFDLLAQSAADGAVGVF